MNRNALIIVLCSTTFLSGCTSNLSDQSLTKAQGVFGGCLAGALLGHTVRNDKKGVMTGCLVGGAVGYAYGDHVASKKAQYDSQEKYLQAVIDEGKTIAENTQHLNKQLRTEIQNIERRQQLLAKQIQDQKQANHTLAALQSETSTWIKKTESAIAQVETEISIQKQVFNDENNNTVPRLVKVGKAQISGLESEERALKIALAQLKLIDERRAI